MTVSAETANSARPAPKWTAYVQLGKLRVYHRLYHWIVLLALLYSDSVSLHGATTALVLVPLLLLSIQSSACAMDDIMGFRDGCDRANYGAADYPDMIRKPLVAGVLSVRQAVAFVVTVVTVATIAVVTTALSLGVDVLPALAIWAVVIGIALQYSGGLKFSYVPGGLELFISGLTVVVTIIPYLMIAHTVTGTVVLIGLLTGSWFLMPVSYGNMADRVGDGAANRRTLAVVLSPRNFQGAIWILYGYSIVLTVLLFTVGDLHPLTAPLLLPVVVMQAVQHYQGIVKGHVRKAMKFGFRCIDVGMLGLTAAILLS
ncbi:UbiA family prenyltransferase [Streptomyces sp. NPDC058572]|uniref:UbiA family prenyltransferase n=1 Tax=Streptomyces sp. NPDC058572 TaxID=3346546 RepID=UPI003658F25B